MTGRQGNRTRTRTLLASRGTLEIAGGLLLEQRSLYGSACSGCCWTEEGVAQVVCVCNDGEVGQKVKIGEEGEVVGKKRGKQVQRGCL